MTRKPQVLAAFPPFAFPIIGPILASDVELIPVTSMEAAQKRLHAFPRIALVLCGVHFDESRMFDLLSLVQESYPRMPFLCCRVLDSEIPQISREAIALAAASLGAAGFVDLPTLAKELGAEPAQQRFRALVLGRLPPRAVEGGAGGS
jgi:hypothetical protein